MPKPLSLATNNPNNDLIFSEEFPGCINIKYKPQTELINLSGWSEDKKAELSSKCINFMYISGHDNYLSMCPINTLPYHPDFLKPKYNKIREIALHGFDFTFPESNEDILITLEELPSGFIKDYSYGLGFQRDYRFIIDAIENIHDVTSICISKRELTHIHEGVYTLNYTDYEIIRKGINRISSNYQAEARKEKSIFSYNALLHELHPDIYPEKIKPYTKDIIFKFISNRSLSESSLSKTDTSSIIDLVSKNKNTFYKDNKEKIIKLKQDIDLVSLEDLISESDDLLLRSSSENEWQSLLNKNPIMLTLLYGYPIIKIKEQAFIGGRRLSGDGDKITDFLIKNNLTNNLGLIEIKKPSTQLLTNKEYRSGVYAPSSELSGSISQMLDQKYKLQKEISSIKDNSGIFDMESYSVDCILIIGTTPTTNEMLKSFELFRHGLKDIKIFTFDELVMKLKNIYSAIKKEE